MASDILQKFLDQNLLNLGEEPDRFDLLTKASADLCDQLRVDRSALAAATSVLLGGAIPETDSTFKLCDAALKKPWPTYRARFVNNVDMLFRAALLQAIDTLVREDNPDFTAIVFYAASGLQGFLSTSGEALIFKDLFGYCRAVTEQAASKLWSAEEVARKQGGLTLAPLDADALYKQLVKAGSQASAGDNPHIPGGAPAEWMAHFAKGAVDGIQRASNAVLKDLATKMLERVDSALDARDKAEHRKAAVLYWKTALYHSGSDQSYRDMTPDHAINYMAYDLYLLLPKFHPRSVEFFLREAVREAIGARRTDEKLTLQAHCESLTRNRLEGIGAPPKPDPGTRITPGRAMWLVAVGAAQPAEAVAQTSLPATATLSRADLATLMLRDYQLHRLSEIKS